MRTFVGLSSVVCDGECSRPASSALVLFLCDLDSRAGSAACPPDCCAQTCVCPLVVFCQQQASFCACFLMRPAVETGATRSVEVLCVHVRRQCCTPHIR